MLNIEYDIVHGNVTAQKIAIYIGRSSICSLNLFVWLQVLNTVHEMQLVNVLRHIVDIYREYVRLT